MASVPNSRSPAVVHAASPTKLEMEFTSQQPHIHQKTSSRRFFCKAKLTNNIHNKNKLGLKNVAAPRT